MLNFWRVYLWCFLQGWSIHIFVVSLIQQKIYVDNAIKAWWCWYISLFSWTSKIKGAPYFLSKFDQKKDGRSGQPPKKIVDSWILDSRCSLSDPKSPYEVSAKFASKYNSLEYVDGVLAKNRLPFGHFQWSALSLPFVWKLPPVVDESSVSSKNKMAQIGWFIEDPIQKRLVDTSPKQSPYQPAPKTCVFLPQKDNTKFYMVKTPSKTRRFSWSDQSPTALIKTICPICPMSFPPLERSLQPHHLEGRRLPLHHPHRLRRWQHPGGAAKKCW